MSNPVENLIVKMRGEIQEIRRRLTVDRWGVVTALGPLTVLQDGDTPGHEVQPDSLVAGLAVGDRVRVQTSALRTLVLGRAGGDIITVTGVQQFENLSPGGTMNIDVAFPRELPVVPVVVASSSAAFIVAAARNQTATGFRLALYNAGNGTPQDAFASWVAVARP